MNDDAMKRLQDRLDQALTPAETAALERDLAADPALATEAAALEGLARLAARARVEAPAGFVDRVMTAIASDNPDSQAVEAPADAPAPRAVTLPRRGFWARFFGEAEGAGWLRPGLVGALALGALAIGAALLIVRLQEQRLQGIPGADGKSMSGQSTQLATATDGATGGETDIVIHRFVLEAAAASKVCLVGDFNDWKLCEVPMAKDPEGHWTVELKLPRGRHQYMFVVDDRQWQTDPGADVRVDDGFGNQNAVVFL